MASLLESFIYNQNDKNINQQLRERIALQMMGNKRAAPKNVGEGLSAIGDAIGDRRLAGQLEESDLAAQKGARDYAVGITGTPAAPQRTSFAPADEGTPTAAAPTVVTPASGPGPAPDGLPYNVLDAQADFGKPGAAPPGNARGQAAGVRAYPDNPDMQAYMSTMGAREQSRPGDTSSTGARGLFQFVPGTAKAYGLVNPDNDAASADAMKAFTEDNIKTFTATNGRPPTMADMALMHQQGGQTGANMVAGTGNASPRNLALNNVPPTAGPQQAAAKIKGYYGVPERVPDDPRAGVTAALAAQQQQPPTALAGPDAQAALPPEITTGQSAAALTPPAQTIAQAPPQRPITAAPQPPQAPQTAPGPGYITPDPGPAPVRTVVPRDPRWFQMERDKSTNAGNPYVLKTIDSLQGELEKRRAEAQKIEDDKYENQTKDWLKRRELNAIQSVDSAAKIQEYDTKQSEGDIKREEARIVRRTGMVPTEFYKRMDEDKASVDQTVKAQGAQQLARKAIKDGVITGYGANMRIAGAKFAAWAKDNGLQGDLAANTEIMSSALKAGLSEAIKTVNGEGGTGVSNTDVRIAEGISGSDPALQMKTIQAIMDRAAEINHRKIDRYERNVDRYLSGESAYDRYAPSAQPLADDAHVEKLLEEQKSDPAKAAWKRAWFNDRYGPGAMDLEIARYERRKKAGGK